MRNALVAIAPALALIVRAVDEGRQRRRRHRALLTSPVELGDEAGILPLQDGDAPAGLQGQTHVCAVRRAWDEEGRTRPSSSTPPTACAPRSGRPAHGRSKRQRQDRLPGVQTKGTNPLLDDPVLKKPQDLLEVRKLELRVGGIRPRFGQRECFLALRRGEEATHDGCLVRQAYCRRDRAEVVRDRARGLVGQMVGTPLGQPRGCRPRWADELHARRTSDVSCSTETPSLRHTGHWAAWAGEGASRDRGRSALGARARSAACLRARREGDALRCSWQKMWAQDETQNGTIKLGSAGRKSRKQISQTTRGRKLLDAESSPGPMDELAACDIGPECLIASCRTRRGRRSWEGARREGSALS